VDFRYTDEQQALQETLRRWISRDYDFERRRALARSPLGFSAEAWARYAELGLLALPIPEEFGGLGGNSVDIMAQSMKAALLPEIAAGKKQFALAAYENAGRYDLSYVACTAVRSGSSWRLRGLKSVVLDAPSADYFLVSGRVSGSVVDTDGISLFLVRRDAPGLSLSAYPTQSGSRAADLRLNDVEVDDDALIGASGQAFGILERAVDRGMAALAAEALGIVSALNQATLSYSKSRKQFGVPIGTFQALQHRMADMYIAGEQIRSMAIVAAVHADMDDAAERHRAIAGAKAYIGEASRFVGQQAVQLHGAMGIVDELIVSHYFKRLTLIDLTFGDADFHLARYSDSLVA
jgi:alkylation response protein AidB-like acyl-CoA dehydrogenase